MPDRLAINTLLIAMAVMPAVAAEAARGAAPIDFARDVQPILSKHCYECHGPETSKSRLRLDSPAAILRGGESGEPVFVAGQSGQSHVIQLVTEADAARRMPRDAEPLTPAEVAVLRAWIDQGAALPGGDALEKPATDHWSFQPLKPVDVPAMDDPFVTNEIDAFILATLREQGLTPSPTADRRTLIRRLYLDVHGVPPTPERARAFFDDERPDAWRRQVDEVLASPRYGERWAAHWLDVVRFAETHGFEKNQPRPDAWPYRDYVIRALNEDKPYDRFVFEQIAGSDDEPAATGYLVAGPLDQVKSPDPVLTATQRQDELHDIVATTGTTFLGLTMGCARCHNHKFDTTITQTDYFAMQAVFAGVMHGERPMPTIASRQAEAELIEVRRQMVELQAVASAFEPLASPLRTLVIDEDDPQRATRLREAMANPGVNPAGAARGHRDDAGDAHRLPNLSGGTYRWWKVTEADRGADLLAYHPAVTGRFRVYLSWGAGFATHAADAQYVLDRDGDLSTAADQTLIAVVDQRRLAGDEGDARPPGTPLWSGVLDAGMHHLTDRSRIVLRAGVTGPAVTADAIVLQEVGDASASAGAITLGAAGSPSFRDPVNPKLNVERVAPIEARFLRFTVLSTPRAEPCIDELEVYTAATPGAPPRNVALASSGAKAAASGTYPNNRKHKLAHLNDGRVGNDRSWISDQAGGGWVQIEFAQSQVIDTIRWGRDRTGKYTDRLATRYVIEAALEPDQWVVVAHSDDRLPHGAPAMHGRRRLAFAPPEERARLESALEALAGLEARQKQLDEEIAQAKVYAGTFSQPGPTHRLYRGDVMSPREVVVPDVPNVFTALNLPPDAPEAERRAAFAAWIVSPDNPLTARVMVNRIWQSHFGSGIVETPSDLGVNGIPPTHPDLLDYLAARFVREGWSMKSMHRLILLSGTYRQSSAPRREAMAIDAGSRWLWRFPPRRLEAEAIHDSVLAVTGALDLTMGGPGFSVFKPNDNYVRVYEPREQWGPSEWRRQIYATKVRMRPDGVFGAFDSPDGGQVAPKRTISTTALQALNLFNSTFMTQQAELFAERLKRDAGGRPADQVRRAYELAYCRAPDEEELSDAVRFIEHEGLPAFCRAVLNSNELVFLP